MSVRVLYGLKTSDQSYLHAFYPTRRFAEEAEKYGLDYSALIIGPGSEVTDAIDFCKGSKVILRGEIPQEYCLALEAQGSQLLNPLAAVALARDKLLSAELFSAERVEHPATFPCRLHEAPPLPFPFVIKPRFGKMGRGVELIRSMAEYLSYSFPGDVLVQEFVSESMGRDIRFFFAAFHDCDKKLTCSHPALSGIRSACVQRQGDSFLSNAHAGGRMSWFAPPDRLLETAQAVFRKSGLRYGTVDFLVKGESDFSICEINSSPGFEELERATGLNAAWAILHTAETER